MKIMPSTRLFGLKRLLLRWAGGDIGPNVRFVSSASFLMNGPLAIGAGTWIGHDVLFIGGNAKISIGANCDVAPRVVFASGTHKLGTGLQKAAGDGYSLPIFIGDGCWIGVGAILLGGAKIGARSVIAAGAVVKGEFPEESMIGGVPARAIKTIQP